MARLAYHERECVCLARDCGYCGRLAYAGHYLTKEELRRRAQRRDEPAPVRRIPAAPVDPWADLLNEADHTAGEATPAA